MTKFFIFIVILFFCNSSFSQTFKNDSENVCGQLHYLIRSNAVNKSNTKLIESILYSKAKDLNSISEVAPLYSEVFELLNDHHGGLKYKAKSYGWSKPTSAGNVYLKGQLKK